MLATDVSQFTRLARGEVILDPALSYDGTTPVQVRARWSEGRLDFSDDGGAVTAAGIDPASLVFPGRIVIGECSVNVTRHGVVWLPGFARSSDQWLAKLPELVAKGSLALYDALLELDD
jgi:hypothetical protein